MSASAERLVFSPAGIPPVAGRVPATSSSAAPAAIAGRAGLREDQLRLGLWIFLATVTMLFAAFTSAYIVRRSGSDWRHITLPSMLWINTAILAASSMAVEIATRLGRRGLWRRASSAFAGAFVLGLAFLGGQLFAWRQMVAAGVYLPSSPHSSFFFMLTGAHAVHVLAALAVLGWALAKTRSAAADPRPWSAQVDLCRTFWHDLGGVWLFLFALVSLY
jgi:cytochrome c oxidase subunit 3